MPIIPNINNEALQLLPDIALWKQQIADAINYKGGEAEPTQAFTELAEDIKDIPNFDQWARLAGVLAGNAPADSLSGHNQNVRAGSITKIIDRIGTFERLKMGCFYCWDLLEEVDLPYLIIIRDRSFSNTSLLYAKFENLEELSGQEIFGDTPILYFYAPNLVRVGNENVFTRVETIRNIVVGKVNKIVSGAAASFKNLRNYQVGEGLDINIPLSNWSAANVINEGQSSINELNSNLRTNLLEKLYDHSGDGETRILQIGWLNYVTPDNIAYANAKGWTLTN